MAFTFRAEDPEITQRKWEIEFNDGKPEIIHGEQSVPQALAHLPEELIAIYGRYKLAYGIQRVIGLKIWNASMADNGDYVECTWTRDGGEASRRGLLSVYRWRGHPIGLFISGYFIRFEELNEIKVLEQYGRFAPEDIPAHHSKGHRQYAPYQPYQRPNANGHRS